jgi:hypothetical protein
VKAELSQRQAWSGFAVEDMAMDFDDLKLL